MSVSGIYTRPLAEVTFSVRWGDMDALGHVNNARYLTYFENARIAWFDALGPDTMNDPRTGPVLATANCTFLKALVYPATVRVHVAGGKPGLRSFGTFYEVTDATDGTLYARGDAVVVWIDKQTGRATELPAALREALDAAALPASHAP